MRDRRSRRRAPQRSRATALAAAVVAVLMVCSTPVTAETVSGCTVNDDTRILESCPTSVLFLQAMSKNIQGIAEDAFPPNSALVYLYVHMGVAAEPGTRRPIRAAC